MASIKIKGVIDKDKSRVKIMYQIIHQRMVARIVTDIEVAVHQWDSIGGRILGDSSSQSAVAADLLILRKVVAALESTGCHFTAHDVKARYIAQKSRPLFLAFVRNEANKKDSMRKLSTARSYRCAANSLERFLGGCDIAFDDVDSHLMERYQAWLSERLCANSISGYMRPLRACYSRMLKSGFGSDAHPFRGVYTGISKTRKRAISESDIVKLRDVDLTGHPALFEARCIFLLCFYLRGISFVDLAFLRKADHHEGRITYKRHKTGQSLSVAVNAKISKMIDALRADDSSPYLLKIISCPGNDEWRQYTSALRIYNKRLKKLAKMVGISSNISSYTVRHSWATIARKKNVKLCTISDGLGHDNESTTQIYLASIDTGELDRANDLIIKNL